jgi:hypothetical protein
MWLYLCYYVFVVYNTSEESNLVIAASDLILRLQDEALKKIHDYCEFVKASKIISEPSVRELMILIQVCMKYALKYRYKYPLYQRKNTCRMRLRQRLNTKNSM